MKPNSELVKILLSVEQAYKKSPATQTSDSIKWAQWWADWLLTFTDFNHLTERDWQTDALAEALLALKTTYDRERPKHHWSHFYALRLSS